MEKASATLTQTNEFCELEIKIGERRYKYRQTVESLNEILLKSWKETEGVVADPLLAEELWQKSIQHTGK